MHSQQTKSRVIAAVKNGMSKAEASRKYKVSAVSISNWLNNRNARTRRTSKRNPAAQTASLWRTVLLGRIRDLLVQDIEQITAELGG